MRGSAGKKTVVLRGSNANSSLMPWLKKKIQINELAPCGFDRKPFQIPALYIFKPLAQIRVRSRNIVYNF